VLKPRSTCDVKQVIWLKFKFSGRCV